MSDLTDVPTERFNSPEHQEWLTERKKQSPCDPQPIVNSGCGAPCESPCTCADEEDRRYRAFSK